MCNCCICDTKKEKPKVIELNLGTNLLREDKVLKLPTIDPRTGYFIQDGATVELVMLAVNCYSIECWERPLRFGKYYGNRVFFNVRTDQFGINPKFVYDAKEKVWVLMNCGYVCFAEQELDYKSNHKLYGRHDA